MKEIIKPIGTGLLEEKTGLVLGLSERPVSVLSEPDTLEGGIARMWLRYVAGSHQTAPPLWLNRCFKWGPHSWPVRYADVPEMEYIDCGVFAAISTEISTMHGLEAYPLQMLLKFNELNVKGWQMSWKEAGMDSHWCAGDTAYHEGTLWIDKEGKGQLFDPQGPFSHSLHESPSYESPVAFRFFSDKEAEVSIGGILARPHQWYAIRGF